MQGKETFRMRWPARQSRETAPKKNTPAIEELDFDEQLYSTLRKHRGKIASEQGIPPFVIFNNQTLEFFARIKPTSIQEGMQIRGVGTKKAERFLPEFVALIAEHLESSRGGSAEDNQG